MLALASGLGPLSAGASTPAPTTQPGTNCIEDQAAVTPAWANGVCNGTTSTAAPTTTRPSSTTTSTSTSTTTAAPTNTGPTEVEAVTVTSPPSTAGAEVLAETLTQGTLAKTGTDTTTGTIAGIALLILGFGLVQASRRRA
jgi:LPXTG-motif cell wall-anchored protein